MDNSADTKIRVAFWNDRTDGRDETVLWLDRDEVGQHWLGDHNTSVEVGPPFEPLAEGQSIMGFVLRAVREWTEAVAYPGETPGSLAGYDEIGRQPGYDVEAV